MASERAVMSRRARQARYRARQKAKLEHLNATGWEPPPLNATDARLVAWASGVLGAEVEARAISDPVVKEAVTLLLGLTARRLSWARRQFDDGRAGRAAPPVG